MRREIALAIAASLALGAASCGPVGVLTCDRTAEGNPTIRYSEGTAADGVYMSSAWDGELLNFPGGMHYAIEHHLGKKPRWIHAYLAFTKDGASEGGILAEASGNQVVILGVDDGAISLANDSCTDYWLLVTAGVGDRPDPP